MSNFAELLKIQGPLIDGAIAKLEKISGYPCEDIHLLNEIELAARARIANLGFDPHDTTGKELYHGLLAKFQADNIYLDNKLHLTSATPIDKRLKIVADFISFVQLSSEVWVLKSSAAKDLLRQHPPKKLMKKLNYRSLDSMLKRANIAEIYAGASVIESSRWQENYKKSYAKLTSQHFQMQPVEIVTMPSKIWDGLPSKTTIATIVPQAGAIALWPTQASKRSGGLSICVKVLAFMESLHTQSVFLKYHQPGGLGVFVDTLWREEVQSVAAVGGLPILWRSLQKYYARLPVENHPNIFDPHVQPKDLYWNNVSTELAKLCPMLTWWVSGEHVAFVRKNGAVSMNLQDVASNYIYDRPYKKRINSAFRIELWEELLHRYLLYPAVEENILNQLEQSITGNSKYQEVHHGDVKLMQHVEAT